MGRPRHHRARGRRKGILASVAYTFRERQLYLRSEGEVQFITLRPWVQAVGLVSVLVGLFWLAFSTINIAFKDQLLALRERGMYDARLEYEDRIASLRKEIDKLNDRLMIDQGEYLGKIDEVRGDYEKLVERHRKLVEFFRQSTGGKSGPVLDQKIFEDPLPESPGDGRAEESSDSLGLNTLPGKNNLNQQQFTARYSSEFGSRAESEMPLKDLRGMFAQYRRMEIALLDETIIQAEKEVSEANSLFGMLGMNPRVIAKSKPRPGGMGGPFIAATKIEDDGLEVARRMEKVLEMRAAFDKLKSAARQLPIARPLAEASSVTSGFGIRRDPFRRGYAMHSGVDFKGSTGTAVLATAPGRVVTAGPEGAYGRMVEIAHDNGVTTRYAHLSEVNVTVGQRVASGSVVGKIGNTGRSTGPHLHYETRVNRRAVDPGKFWQAQHAVQKLWQEE
jgi:murein DD-endopeptidase MepM/ murein hydrolase activator NlpD